MALNYKPSEDFEVNKLQSLVDFDVTGSKELWLIQCPISHFPDIEGKEIKVKLDEDGVLGGFQDSSGKEVNLVSFASQEANAAVIIPSENESKIVGKISRRVSLVRFPEPNELLDTTKVKTQQKLVRAAVTNSSFKNTNPFQSSRSKSGQSALRHSTSTHSSRHKGIVPSSIKTPMSDLQHSTSTHNSRHKGLFPSSTKTPMSSKRKHSEPASSSKHQGSSDRSGKSMKKVKTEK